MFKQLFRFALAAGTTALLAAGTAQAQFNVIPGRDYTPLNPPQPTSGDATVEVLEFFAYGCIHCFHLEPKLEKWASTLPKDTKLTRVPTPFPSRGLNSVPIFYTLEAMDLLDKLHYKIFEAVHNENLTLGNPEVRNQWLAKQGVDLKKFQEVEKSFAVQNKIKRATEMSTKYRIESTPTLVVNGKYAVPNQNNTDTTFRVIDTLAFNERAAAKTATPATAPVAVKPGAPAKPAPAKPAPAPAKPVPPTK